MEWQGQSESTFWRLDTQYIASCFPEKASTNLTHVLRSTSNRLKHLCKWLSFNLHLFDEIIIFQFHILSKPSTTALMCHSPPYFFSSHTSLIAVSWNPQAHSHLGGFASASLSSLNTSSRYPHGSLPSRRSLINDTLAEKPPIAHYIKQRFLTWAHFPLSQLFSIPYTTIYHI